MKFIKKLKILYKNRKKPLLGLDISDTYVRMSLIEFYKDKYILKSCAETKLAETVIIQDEIKSPERLSNAISKVYREINSNIKKIAIAIPDTAVITKNISIEGDLSSKELEEHVNFMVSKHIPYPLSDIYVDFQLAKGDANKFDVLIVAAKRQTIDVYKQVIGSAGLELSVIDVKSFLVKNVCNYLKKMPDHECDATNFIEINSNQITLSIFVGSSVVLIKSEELLNRVTNDCNSKKNKLDTIVFCVKRFWEIYRTMQNIKQIKRILLFGNESHMSDLEELLSDEFSVPCDIINIFEDILVVPSLRKASLINHASSWLISCALSLRENRI